MGTEMKRMRRSLPEEKEDFYICSQILCQSVKPHLSDSVVGSKACHVMKAHVRIPSVSDFNNHLTSLQ